MPWWCEVTTTRYARSGDLSIAYQARGASEVDLVMTPGFVSNLELLDQQREAQRFHDRLASFSRLLTYDNRGTGLSDPVADIGTLEDRVDDLMAVMDAAGARQAALLGVSEGAE